MKRAVMGVMVAVLLCAGGYCAYRYYDEALLPEKRIADADEVQQELFKKIKPSPRRGASADSAADSSPDESRHDGGSEDGGDQLLAAAREVNDGTVGWITIPGTYIDYPIARGEDNEFYLQHGFLGDYNYGLGCPFLDYRCEADFSGYNSIVYAHHLTRRRMFADVALYKDESFMQTCPKGILTDGSGQHEVRFFAYLSVPGNDHVYHVAAEGEEADYAEYLLDMAEYTKDITLEELTGKDTRLLLLSTCTYETEDTRGVLAGIIGR